MVEGKETAEVEESRCDKTLNVAETVAGVSQWLRGRRRRRWKSLGVTRP